MAWRIEIDKDVQRSMKKLDKQIARRIVAKLHEISQLEDPRSMGKGLTENKSGLWRYRVGDYCAREPPRVVPLPLRQRHIRHEGVLQDGRV